MHVVKQSTAFTDTVGPILDSTGAEYTGAVIGDLSISKNGTEAAMAAAATLTHISNGMYALVFTTGNTDTLGRIVVRCNKSTYQMPPVRYEVLASATFDTLVTNGTLAGTTSGRTIVTDAAGLVDANTVKLGPTGAGTAQTAKDLGAINVTNLNTLSGHDPGATLGTSTLTQAQVTGGAYALSTDANGRVRIVDGTGVGEIDTNGGAIVTVTSVTNQLTAAAIATGVWQDSTAGDFTAASSIGKSLYTSGVVPGGSGGLLISGSNSGTTTLGALTITGATTHTGNVVLSDGLTISAPSTLNRAGITITGNGSGAGIITTGGSTGNGFTITGGASGHGLAVTGVGTTKHGIIATGSATTGAGLNLVGGGTSGDGLLITTTSGHGMSVTATGASKHGAIFTGGDSGTSDGFKVAAGTGGVGFRLDTLTASGAITLSGAVSLGSTLGVTGAITASNASNNIVGIDVAKLAGTAYASADFSATMKTSITAAVPTATAIRNAVTGGAYALDTDANGRIRIVDGTAAGELDTASGKVLLAATQAFDNTGTWTGNITGNLSGSVGSVSGAVGSVTGAVGSIASGGIAAASIATAAAEKLADVTLRRTPTNIEASSFGDTLALGSLYGLIQQAQKSDTTTHAGKLTVFKVNGVTELGQLTITTSPTAEPITSAL